MSNSCALLISSIAFLHLGWNIGGWILLVMFVILFIGEISNS